jgi:hypothetical protein
VREGRERGGGDMTGVICQFLAYLLCFSSTGISIMDGGWIGEAHRPLPERRANSMYSHTIYLSKSSAYNFLHRFMLGT